MKKIGITGGIGCGKTTASKVFSLLGVPIYNADERSKTILDSSSVVIEKVKQKFGDDIYESKGINRKKLAAIVFANPELLNELNQIVHPAVFDDFDNWCLLHENEPYILKEAALIFETILHQKLDKIIVITASEELRLSRVMQRDGSTQEEVRKRIQNQMSEKEKIERADFVIHNDEQQLIIPQILSIHEILKK